MKFPIWSDKRVLIVEDDQISLEFLKEILEPAKVSVLTATNGIEAINICKDNSDIDLVLMDVQLPSISGTDAMVKIKEQNPEIYIIAQTAFAMSGDKEKYLKAGFDDYIAKPIVLEEFLEKLTNLFKN